MTHEDLHAFASDTTALGRTTTLLRENGLRALLLHLKAAEQIPPHQTKGAITLQCLKGEAVFSIGDQGTPLKAGALIGVPPSVMHSVTAQQDTLLLVTVWEPVRNESS